MKDIQNKRKEYPKEYIAWSNMIQRCLNPKNRRYKDYGGRGISISESWLEFDNFLKELGVSPSKELTLERLDNNKGYSKENCNWVSRKEQQRNQRIRKDNTSGYRGVWFRSNRKRWVAEFYNKYIGSFKTKEEANFAYENFITTYNT